MHASKPAVKVVHVYKTYFPDTGGGLEQTIRQICIATRQHGIQSTVVTTTKGQTGELRRDEARVLRFRSDIDLASTPFSFSLWRHFAGIAQAADIVHYHFPWPQADLLQATAGSRVPSVITYHSDIVRQRMVMPIYRPLMQRFLSASRRIVVTSPNYLESSRDLQPYRAKCAVIPIGLEEESYPPASTEKQNSWSARFGEVFFLFVGVLRYYKGLEYLVRAARGASYPVVIAGAGPMERQLKSLAASLEARNVHFVGYVGDDDRACLLSLCRAVVFPSHERSEAFGVSLLEAAMAGKPMISTEIGTGTSYVNLNDVTGFVVAPADPGALRTAMDRLATHPDNALSMGRAARNRYRELFTAERMGAAYAELYREVLRECDDSNAGDK